MIEAVLAVLAVLGLAVVLIAVGLVQLSRLQEDVREVKARLEALRPEGRAASWGAEAARREAAAAPVAAAQRAAAWSGGLAKDGGFAPATPAGGMPVLPAAAPSAAGAFLRKAADWFFVRGDFAPEGTTREFAVATRWLLRAGAAALAGAIAYFLTLAIRNGWIGPAQRVFGMMFWGVAGAAGGAWLKERGGKYAALGEVFAALGVTALYLAFGLGHRFFTPPVIASAGLAFTGLAVAVALGGALSVRLKSAGIATLALAGGFAVPGLTPFPEAAGFHLGYLALLCAGAFAVAHLRQWALLGYAAFGAAYILGLPDLRPTGGGVPVGGTLYLTALAGGALALAVLGAKRRSAGGNGWCWAAVAAGSAAWMLTLSWLHAGEGERLYLLLQAALAGGAAAYAGLAWGIRRRGWGDGSGVPVLLAFAPLFAAVVLALQLGAGRLEPSEWTPLCYCLFAGALAELGVRTREKTLGVAGAVAAVALAVAFACLLEVYGARNFGARGFWERARLLWGMPALYAFCAWRKAAGGRVFGWLGAVSALAVVSCESHWFGVRHLPQLGDGAVTIAWAGIALGMLAWGIFRRRAGMRHSGLVLLGLAALKVLAFDTASLPVTGRAGVCGAVGALLMAGAFLYLRAVKRFRREE